MGLCIRNLTHQLIAVAFQACFVVWRFLIFVTLPLVFSLPNRPMHEVTAVVFDAH